MNSKEAYREIIELIIDDYIDSKFELLKWAFLGYSEAEAEEAENNVQ